MGFLNDALQSNNVRISESSSAYYLGTSDPDYQDNLNNGFRRLTKTQNERDLMPLEQQRQTEIALFLYDSNPLAKRIIDLVNSFVTGDGFTFNSKNPKVLDVLKRFWEDPVNDWPMKQLDRFRQLSLLGEALWPAAVRKADGRVRIGYVDPANIEEIIPDPNNPEIFLTACIRAGYRVDGATELPTKYSLINIDERYLSPSYGKLNFYPEPYGAFYFAINKPSNATRGRSDLITVFDWLDLYDQHLFGAAERATYLTDFVWDVEMKGADEATLKRWHRENSMPRGAAMRVHNENMKWQAIAPSLNAGDSDMMAKLIKMHILTALGLPPSWISDPGDTNRCFDNKTKYLTKNGWKYYEEIFDGEPIGTYNSKTKSLEYQVPTSRYQYDYDGLMVRIKRSHVDFLVTPNHRMYLGKLKHSNSFHNEDFLEAGDLIDKKGIYRIPTEIHWTGTRKDSFLLPACEKVKNDYHSKDSREIEMEPWLKFLGYWISEGCLSLGENGHFRVSLCQKKPDKVNKIRDTLKLLPFHVHEYQYPGRAVEWIIHDKALFLWLEDYAGKGAKNKKVPSFIFDLPPDQIMIFLEALMLGDGSWERDRLRNGGNSPAGGYYWSTSQQLIDDMQLLFLQCGYHPLIKEHSGRSEKWNTCYELQITPARYRGLSTQGSSACQKQLVDYNGKVSCFEVPNGLLITRRGGVVNISGNSVGVSMAGPVLKSLSHRQRFAKAMLTRIFQFVIDQAILSGRLHSLSKEELSFEVLSPSLTPADMSSMSATMRSIAQSIKLAEDQGWLSHPTAAKVFLNLLSELGMQVSIDDELSKVGEIVPRSAAPAPGPIEPEISGELSMEGIGEEGPRGPTGSELMTPIEQLANQISDRQATGSTVTRKGNPAG